MIKNIISVLFFVPIAALGQVSSTTYYGKNGVPVRQITTYQTEGGRMVHISDDVGRNNTFIYSVGDKEKENAIIFGDKGLEGWFTGNNNELDNFYIINQLKDDQ